MLSVDDASGGIPSVQIEAISPLVRDNALLVDNPGYLWLSASLERTAALTASGGVDVERRGWTTTSENSVSVNRKDAPAPVMMTENHWVRIVRTEMQMYQAHMNAEVVRLSSAVEELTKAVTGLRGNLARQDDDLNLSETAPLPQAPDTDDLASALNQIAEMENLWSEEWSSVSVTALSSPDPTIRAAAARAIGAHGDKNTVAQIAARIETESNKFVRSVFRSALDAVSA